jgi:uncharacterized protein with FMN-binding domain
VKRLIFRENKKTKIYAAAAVCITTFILTMVPACADISMKQQESSVTDYKLVPPTEGKIYKDGFFTGYSDATDGGYAMALLQVKQDTIVDAVLKEFDELSLEKDFNSYGYAPAAYAGRAMEQEYIKTGVAEVDFVTGATISSSRYNQAVSRALSRARKLKEKSRYLEGVYQGRSKSDRHGYAVAIIELKSDKIVNVRLKEIDPNGKQKDSDSYPYGSLKDVYDDLSRKIVQANTYNIDNFTGATRSTEKIKDAIKNALAKAEIEPYLSDLIDGTYSAPSDADDRGYATATVMIENGQIVDVVIKEYDKNSSEKDSSTHLYEPVLYANSELPLMFIEAQSDEIDVVSGATISSRKYQQAVKRALISASVSSLHSPGARDLSITRGPMESRFR